MAVNKVKSEADQLNVVIFGLTSRLVQLVQAIVGIEDTFYVTEGEAPEVPVFLLDGIEFPQLEQILSQYPTRRLLYVFSARHGLAGDLYKQMREKCQLHHIELVTDLSDEQIVEELERKLFPQRFTEKVQPAIGLIGCHRRSGASTLSGAIAREVAAHIHGKVAVIDLHPYALKEKRAGIWQIYREYEGGSLTPERILEIATETGERVFEIAGNPKLDHARSYRPELLEQVYAMIEGAFDFTLFAIHPFWDNTLTLVALKQIRRKYLLATSKEEEMDEFYAVLSPLQFQMKVDLKGMPFIFNLEGVGGETKTLISSKLNAGNVLAVPLIPRIKTGDTGVLQGLLGRFADQLIADFGLQRRELETRKRAGWKILGRGG